MAIFGANRIELESQILCAALRQSWADTDAIGMVKACQELYQLYPDLLPPPRGTEVGPPSNYYEVLEINCDVNPSMVLAAYFKAVKKFLRETPKPRDRRKEYYRLLNAGFILRKPRSRLSHDLIVARDTLVDGQIIPRDGTLEIIAAPQVVQPAEAEPEAESQIVADEPLQETVPAVASETLPMLIELLQLAQFIGAAEVQALKNQMRLYPDIPLVELVLHAGYVSEAEMKSMQLAEFVISSGKIRMDQFRVVLNEKRTWTNLYFPPEDPPEPSAIPRQPLPD